jgi:hypothetical protein
MLSEYPCHMISDKLNISSLYVARIARIRIITLAWIYLDAARAWIENDFYSVIIFCFSCNLSTPLTTPYFEDDNS